MCQSELAKNPTQIYRTLWSKQSVPEKIVLTVSPANSVELVYRLERVKPSGSWSDAFKAQFNAPVFEREMSGEEIIAQLKKNPPFTIPREFKVHE